MTSQERVPVPEIVLGPPGTGKTTTLIGYVQGELEAGVHPDRIGYLSFTKRAAYEAADRACKKFKKERDDFPYFRTLHSLCFRFLGLNGADVLEGKRLRDFAESVGVRLNGRWSEDGSLMGFEQGDRIIFMENLSRIRRVTLEEQYQDYNDGLPWDEVHRVASALREYKEEQGLVDYTDMLLDFVRQGIRPNLEVLFVDEAQDLSLAQWDVVRLLARGTRRVVMAGDDDQAIYRWAGADVDKFVDMRGLVRVLPQSWRVPVAVQEVAMRPVPFMGRRREKEWRPRREDGKVDTQTEFQYCDYDGDDVLILARNDYILREQVEPLLRMQGVIYEKHGFPSVRRSVVDTILSWERLRRGESVTGEEARRVYKAIRADVGVRRGHKELPGVGDEDTVDMAHLREKGGLMTDGIWHEALDLLTQEDRRYILEARRHGEKVTSKPRVRISTIHGAKGGEADHVILFKEMAMRTHAEMRDNMEDEARVWYVGATRARKRLTVVDTRTMQECPWL
jgi:DNA helicase II / ATP-dependent DNA helicase PcrA